MPTSKNKKSADVTVGDIVKALDAVDEWVRLIRQAMATLDQNQVLDLELPLALGSKPPTVLGRLC